MTDWNYILCTALIEKVNLYHISYQRISLQCTCNFILTKLISFRKYERRLNSNYQNWYINIAIKSYWLILNIQLLHMQVTSECMWFNEITKSSSHVLFDQNTGIWLITLNRLEVLHFVYIIMAELSCKLILMVGPWVSESFYVMWQMTFFLSDLEIAFWVFIPSTRNLKLKEP